MKDLQSKSLKAVRRAGPKLIELAVNYDELFRNVYGLSGGLAEACEAHMRHLDSQGQGHLFSALLSAYHSDHSVNWSDSRKTTWDWFLKQLPGLGDRLATTLDSEFWSKWLNETAKEKEWSDRTYNDVITLLSGVWRHACNQAKVTRNPMLGVKPRKIRRKHVPVYSVEQVQSLMMAAREFDRDLVPFFPIAIFAGLRPGDKDSEIKNLQWEDINFKERWIRVATNFDNKTGTKRFVPMEDNLLAWLKDWSDAEGAIIPVNFVRRRRVLVRGKYQSPSGTPEEEWTELVPYGEEVRDITRHTYGSYLDAKYRDRNVVMANMGHTNFRTYEQHYKNARSPQEAARFWAIMPPSGKGSAKHSARS